MGAKPHRATARKALEKRIAAKAAKPRSLTQEQTPWWKCAKEVRHSSGPERAHRDFVRIRDSSGLRNHPRD